MADGIKIPIKYDNKGFDQSSKDIVDSNEDVQVSLEQTTAIAAGVFAGFAGSIGLAVNEAGKIEGIRTRFEVLTGSVEQADQTLRNLQNFAATTPFQLEGIADTAAQLTSFGVESEALLPTLQSIGDVAAASGSDLKDVGLIFGQISAAGKLTGERLLQLQERGIPIGPALADTLGVAETAVADLVSKGVVDFATFEAAFNSLSAEGGAAFGGMEKQSQTLQGVLSTLSDNFSLLLANIGNQFLPTLKSAAVAVTEFVQVIAQDEELVQLIAIVAAAGAAIAGLVTTLGTIGIAVSAAGPAIAGLGTAFTLMTGPIGIAVAAIAGLVAAVVAIADHFDIGFRDALNAAKAFASAIVKLFGSLGTLITGVFTLDTDKIAEGLNAAKEAAIASVVDTKEALLAEDEAADVERAEAANERLMEQGETKRDLAAEQNEMDKEQQAQFNEEKMAAEDENQQLAIQSARERAQMLLDKQKETDQKSVMQLKTTEELKAQIRKENQDRIIKDQNAANKRFLEMQQKHNKAVAELDKFLGSQRVGVADSTAGELAKLQQSENETLRSIGKAAAVTQITIDTAKSAMSIYTGFATIPIVGPILGVAGAAAAVAFGAEQIAKVTAAQDGGLITGGVPGRDSVPALLAPGELVAPAQNFDEVVNAVARARSDEDQGFAAGGGAGMVEIFINDDASQLVTAEQIEDEALGVSQRSVI